MCCYSSTSHRKRNTILPQAKAKKAVCYDENNPDQKEKLRKVRVKRMNEDRQCNSLSLKLKKNWLQEKE